MAERELEVGISFSPGWLGFGKNPGPSGSCKFPLRMGLIKNNRALSASYKMVTVPYVGSTRGFISDDHSEKSCEVQRGKTYKSVKAAPCSPRLDSLEFSTLKLIYTETPAIPQL